MASNRHDRWMFPFRLNEDNRSLSIEQDDGLTIRNATITLEGEIFISGSGDSALLPDGYVFLFDEILERLVEAVNKNDLHSAPADVPFMATPSDYTLEDCGFSLDFGGIITKFEFSSEDWTFPPQYIGWPADQLDDVSFIGQIISPLSIFGQWQSVNIVDDEPTSKFSYPEREVYWSTREKRRTTRQTETRRELLTRRFLYEYVPSLAVLGGTERAEDEAYWSAAKLGEGDTHNAFIDVWRAMVEVGPCVVKHDSAIGFDGASFAGDRESEFELVDIRDIGDAEDPSSFLQERNTSGELFDIDLNCLALESNYDY